MTLALTSDVTATPTEHGTVLLDQRNGRYFQLNASATLALTTLLNGADHQHTADVLHRHYDITHDRAHADVATLIDTLRTRKLVTA
ncbi:hypothetical protein GCM10010372_84320 [Streptomyces tauricus]|uniref:lasso peptide biosynthesis PqqD family chaperone n=1 Tax=Streptomyces tauricus TaxID=68274 RepID=UPI00167735D3|nr:lasso peptide biosynthesis PqqD family chaperone [Streptomyces tauricus]GHA72883.1 hypothetical protein GCM10010372_84320 [Streptomyces tauricus]